MDDAAPDPTFPDQPVQSSASGRFVRLAAAIVIVLSAVALYRAFWPEAGHLWYAPAHDRNGHYQRSQRIALALREGSLRTLVSEIHAATVWPPLHPLVTGSILAVGGLDARLAVLSSLVAWATTCWFAFALAYRLAPRGKALAGGVALLFMLASPAHRAYAVDVMIESMGAALTLAVLFCYVTSFDECSASRGRWLGLSLFALLLTKSNYWTLVAAGLAPALLYRYRRPVIEWLRSVLRPDNVWDWLAAQVRHPMTYVLLPAFAFAGYVRFVGPVSFTLAGRTIASDTLNFPAELCYILLVVRLLPWWLRSGRAAAAHLPVPLKQAAGWFGYPLAVWWLWPNRLGAFLDSVGRTEHGRVAEYSRWLGSIGYYWGVLGTDYHASEVCLIIAVVFAVVAIASWLRWERGGAAVFSFLIVAAVLTNYHPANRGRFLFTWLATAWVAAGVGAAWLVDRLSRNWVAARSAVSWGVIAVLACAQGPTLLRSGHAEEGGPRRELSSLASVADAVASEAATARRPALLASPPLELVFDWRLAETRAAPARVLTPPRQMLATANADDLPQWLRSVDCDLLLLVDVPPLMDAPPTAGFDFARLRGLVEANGLYEPVADQTFAECPGLHLQTWRRSIKSPEREDRAASHVVEPSSPR
jgi:hypothetical protein